MRPLIRNNYGLVKLKNNVFSIGDIIIIRHYTKLVAHRLVWIQKNSGRTVFISKGDALRHFDIPVCSDDVIGKVVILHYSKHRIYLTSLHWKIINYLLAILSLLEGSMYHSILKFLNLTKLKKVF